MDPKHPVKLGDKENFDSHYDASYGALALNPLTVNPLMARQVASQRAANPRGILSTPQQALDLGAGILGMVPGIGDAMGLAADIHRYITDPESRTWPNFGLTGLGLLPFMPGMTVFHGSPHKFDQFDMSKVGTGEGAQAYGHGLYFAENPAVAKQYQTDLAPKGSQGSLYKVDLPDEHIGKMLDWDLPLSQQPKLQDVATKLGVKPKINVSENPQFGFLMVDSTGGDVVEAAIAKFGKEGASQFLKQHGIPGIKYLDQGSREGGKGTHNFVVFDDQLPKILGNE